jgi:hypothetical protein
MPEPTTPVPPIRWGEALGSAGVGEEQVVHLPLHLPGVDEEQYAHIPAADARILRDMLSDTLDEDERRGHDNRVTVWPTAGGGIQVACRDCLGEVFRQDTISTEPDADTGVGFVRLSQLNEACDAHQCADAEPAAPPRLSINAFQQGLLAAAYGPIIDAEEET